MGSIPAGVTKTKAVAMAAAVYAPLAQLVEQLTLNQRAQGSSPWRCTKEPLSSWTVVFLLSDADAFRCPTTEISNSSDNFLSGLSFLQLDLFFK